MSPKWEREEKVGVPEGSMHGPWIVGNTEMSGLQIFDADMTRVSSICGNHHCNNINYISSLQALPRIEKDGVVEDAGKTVIYVIG